ncbi:hypothetical protein PpBr36_01664, partial [Pyricularia pennisetigena]|uniref:hypothetical protein n=1 Tax=Pyricularia pennisetigena TaxID=1578925 RepID=UPI00114DE5C1
RNPYQGRYSTYIRYSQTTRQEGSGSHSRSPKIKLALCQSSKWVIQPHEARTCADIPTIVDDQGIDVCIATLFVWRGGGEAITQSL